MPMRFASPLLFILLGFTLTLSAQPNLPHGMGLPDGPDEEYEQMLQKANLTGTLYRNIGRSASLKPYAPIPGDQGMYGTCAAWATAYAARTIVEAQRKGWTDRNSITNNAYSYGFVFRIFKPYDYKCWGASTSALLDIMQVYGVPPLGQYNVHCPSDPIPQWVYGVAKPHVIQDYARLWSPFDFGSKRDVMKVKKSLSEGNPVVISMITPESFHYAKDLWAPTESPGDPISTPHGKHAMCVVGYDDDKYGGAFEVQNSWGTSWGNGGYVWIRYRDFANFVYQAVELVHFDKPSPKPKPQPKPEPEFVSLEGGMRLQLETGKTLEARHESEGYYDMDQALRSGDRFRLYLTNSEPCYVYAFGSDLSKTTYRVFPGDQRTSAALNYSQNEVAIPDEDHHLRLDARAGTDYLCVIYSKEKIDFEELLADLESGSGSFADRVERELGNRLISGASVRYETGGEIGFKANSKQGTAVALIVEIEHD